MRGEGVGLRGNRNIPADFGLFQAERLDEAAHRIEHVLAVA